MTRTIGRYLPIQNLLGSAIFEQFKVQIALCVAYGLAIYGCMIAFVPGGAAGLSFWPPAGIAAAFALRFGWRSFPSLLIGAAIANTAGYISFTAAAPHFLIAALSANLGAEAYRYLGRRRTVLSITDFMSWVVICAVIATFITACAGRLYMVAIGRLSLAQFMPSMLQWWMGDALGVLVVGTAVLVLIGCQLWTFDTLLKASTGWVIAWSLVCVILAFPAYILEPFLGDRAAQFGYHPYMLCPAIIMIAIRLGLPGAAIGVLVVVTGAMTGLALGVDLMEETWRTFELQAFLAVLSLTAYITAFMTHERRELRASVHSGEQIVQQTVRAIRDGIAVYNREGRIIEANKALEDILSLSREDIIGKTAHRPILLLWEDDGSPVPLEQHPSRMAMRTATAVAPRLMRCVTSRREFWAEISSAPILDDSGKITGAVTIVRDQTDPMVWRRIAEKNGLEFARIADNLPVLIYMTDRDGNTVYENEGWGKLLLNRSDLKVNWKMHVRDEELAQVLAREDIAISRRERYEERYRLRRHDGVEVWMLDIGVPRFDDSGEFLGYIGCLIDVNEEQALKSKIAMLSGTALSNEVAQAMLEQFSERAEAVASEVKKEAKFLAPEARDRIAQLMQIERQVREMASDRRDSGANQAPCHVRPAIDEAVRHISPLLGDEWRLEARMVTGSMVGVSRSLLANMVMSLVANAKEAMPNGGTIELTVQALSDREVGWWTPGGGGWIKIEVKDSGRGIETDDLTRVTRPFWSGRPDGIGLGLAMVDISARDAGGRIDIESTSGRGTTVRVFLPVWRAEEKVIQDQGQVPVGRGEKVTLAMIEDELLQPIEAEVARLGYEVVRSTSIDLAALERGVDLIIADPLLTERLQLGAGQPPTDAKAAPRRRSGKILWVSRMRRFDLERHGLVAKDDLFLQVPYRLEAIATSIRDGIARGRASLWNESA